MVAQVSVGVVHTNRTFLVDQALVGMVKVFPSLLCVLFDKSDGLVNGFGEGLLIERERGGSVVQFFG